MLVLFPEISLVIQDPIPYHLREVDPGLQVILRRRQEWREDLTNNSRDAQIGKYGSCDAKESSFGDSCSRVLETKVVPLVEREEGLESVLCTWTSSP